MSNDSPSAAETPSHGAPQGRALATAPVADGAPLRIWVVTDGRAGNEKPAVALAEGVAAAARRGGEVSVKRLSLRPGAALLPPKLWLLGGAARNGWPFIALRDAGRSLEPPYPDLVIGAGRRSAPFVVALRRLSGGGARAVQILDPKIDLGALDLVVTPAHDDLSGPSVVNTIGSIHDVGPESLAGVSDPRLSGLGKPLIGVLIGGPSGANSLEIEDIDRLIDALRPAAAAGAGLAATASRRTPKTVAERLETEIRGFGGFYWSGEGDNPYRAILAQSDALVVTADSVNMASEAAGSGKPVFIASIAKVAPKLQKFHKALRIDGYASPLPAALTPRLLSQAKARRLDDRGAAVARILDLIEPAPRSGPKFG